MTSRLAMKEERKLQKESGFYFERHHIVPVSIGGGKSRCVNSGNIVLLTAREHFISHWLLWRIHGTRQMAYAFISMTRIVKINRQYRYYSSIGYSEARLAYSEINKGNKFGRGNKGKIPSKERLKNQSETLKRKYASGELIPPMLGRKHSDESLKIMSKIKKKRGAEHYYWKGYRLVYLNGELKGRFKTNSEISKFIGASEVGIRNVLHGSQRKTNGYEIKYETKRIMNLERKCSAPDCNNRHHANGYCTNHYTKKHFTKEQKQKWYLNRMIRKNPNYIKRRELSSRDIDGIIEMYKNGAKAKEISKLYNVKEMAIYYLFKKRGYKIPNKVAQKDMRCKELGCNERCYCKGYCLRHYMKNLKNTQKIKLAA